MRHLSAPWLVASLLLSGCALPLDRCDEEVYTIDPVEEINWGPKLREAREAGHRCDPFLDVYICRPC